LERKPLRKFKFFIECCYKQIHHRKELKKSLFAWIVYFEASERTFLKGKGVVGSLNCVVVRLEFYFFLDGTVYIYAV